VVLFQSILTEDLAYQPQAVGSVICEFCRQDLELVDSAGFICPECVDELDDLRNRFEQGVRGSP